MKKTQAVVEKIVLPTYSSPAPEDLPVFAQSRVHQRSSGNPYPRKVVCDVDRTPPVDQEYTVIRLENDYLRILLLPQLGGRIFEAYDKVNDYHFFYRQHVIKPALIGMLGSWISGGVEFNWPCHHRPSTFMPVDYSIEYDETGAATVWMSENEPLDRMKGMVGIRLAPDEAALDTLMRVYNRTPQRHSFLWWENAAVPVNESYRIFFPHDVRHVQFHYRKNVTTYPLASGQYNGIRMGENSVDIRFHKNTRQPTSYFCGETRQEFFGGYDEGRQRGVVHIANRHLSIGKKMFTWAYNQLSQSWEKALTDTDGAYAELMASSYSANQPDFAWLEPYETKSFSQRWYPIGEMGVPDFARKYAAAHLTENGVVIQVTRPLEKGILSCSGREYPVSARPGEPILVPCGPVTALTLKDGQGNILLDDALVPADDTHLPSPLPSLPSLDAPGSAQDLYLRGVHIDQYRDPAVHPNAYYQKALEKDPRHIPSLLAMAEYEWQNGRYENALAFANRCRSAEMEWNFHPESGKLEYITGLIYEGLGRNADAYDAYYRAYWNLDCRTRAMIRIAALDGKAGNCAAMLDHAREAMKTDAENPHALAEAAVAHHHLGQPEKAQEILSLALSLDPQDCLALSLQNIWQGNPGFVNNRKSDPAQQTLDMAFDLCDLGQNEWALQLLSALEEQTVMTSLLQADILGLDSDAGKHLLDKADQLSFGQAYPHRLQEEALLKRICAHAPSFRNPRFALGCLACHRRNYQQAYDLWHALCLENENDWQALRCLGIVCYSYLNQRQAGYEYLSRAQALQPQNAHLAWEKAHVMHRLAMNPRDIAAFLSASPVCDARDDLALERARALNLAGEWEQALDLMLHRAFVPCEGGEHAVAEQYMFACHALGRKEMKQENWEKALSFFRMAQHLPDHLGAGLWNDVLLVPHKYYEGLCLQASGRETEAEACLRFVIQMPQDYFSDMHLPELPCYQSLAYRALGLEAAAIEKAARHYQQWEKARAIQDPGHFKTTPFFLCFLEDAKTLRDFTCSYHCGFALSCFPGRQQEARALLLRSDPTHLYARLMTKM